MFMNFKCGIKQISKNLFLFDEFTTFEITGFAKVFPIKSVLDKTLSLTLDSPFLNLMALPLIIK